MTRDPRIDPAVGDVLRKGAATRTVVKSPPVGRIGTVYYTNQRGTACSCWITTWRIWSKGAEVEQTA